MRRKILMVLATLFLGVCLVACNQNGSGNSSLDNSDNVSSSDSNNDDSSNSGGGDSSNGGSEVCLHTTTELITVKAASCFETGVGNRRCLECGESVGEEVIAKTAHTSGNSVANEYLKTYTGDEGNAEFYKSCQVCGERLNETFTIAVKASESYMPTSPTVTLYETVGKLSYGFTWNCLAEPLDMGLLVAEASSDDWTYYEAEVVESTTYANQTTTMPFYVCKAVLDLQPETSYTYKIVENVLGVTSDTFNFTAVNPTKDSFTFASFGDSQDTAGNDGTLWNEILSKMGNVDFYLHAGDICEDTKEESNWTSMLNTNREYLATTPIMVAAGNHDTRYKSDVNAVFRHFNNNIPSANTDAERGYFYSFIYGNIKFIMLNTNLLTSGATGQLPTAQYNWLVSELQNNNAQWTIVTLHNPLYSVGKYGNEAGNTGVTLDLREQLSDLFAQYGVDLVIQGHDHVLSKTYPIGQGNTPLTSTGKQEINGVFYDVNPNAPIYIMHGPAGNQAQEPQDKIEEQFYELCQGGKAQSWAEYSVTGSTLTITMKYVSGGTVYEYCSFGIIKSTVVSDVTEEGAHIFFDGETSGIGFSGYINESYLTVNPTAEMGMLIIPASELNGAELTATTAGVRIIPANVTINENDWFGIDGYKRFTSVLWDIAGINYGADIVARAYVKLGDSYLLADATQARSIAEAASGTLAKGDTHKTQLNTYVDSVNPEITVDEDEFTLALGVEIQIQASVTPTNLKMVYASGDLNVVTVDEDGFVRTVGVGTTSITITVGSEIKTISVTVERREKNIPTEATLVTGFDGTGYEVTQNTKCAVVMLASEVNGASGAYLTKVTTKDTWAKGGIYIDLTQPLDLTTKGLHLYVNKITTASGRYGYVAIDDVNGKTVNIRFDNDGWQTISFTPQKIMDLANADLANATIDASKIVRIRIYSNVAGAEIYLDSAYTLTAEPATPPTTPPSVELPDTKQIPTGATLVTGFDGDDYTAALPSGKNASVTEKTPMSVSWGSGDSLTHVNNGTGTWGGGAITLTLKDSFDLTGKTLHVKVNKIQSGSSFDIYIIDADGKVNTTYDYRKYSAGEEVINITAGSLTAAGVDVTKIQGLKFVFNTANTDIYFDSMYTTVNE